MGFSMTTRKVAALANVRTADIYVSLHRSGHWRGVAPRKLHTGRLLWPAAEVCDALGIMATDAPQQHRMLSAFIEREGLPICPETLALGRAFLAHRSGTGDPSELVSEACLVSEIVHAWASRVLDSRYELGESDWEQIRKVANRTSALALEVRNDEP